MVSKVAEVAEVDDSPGPTAEEDTVEAGGPTRQVPGRHRPGGVEIPTVYRPSLPPKSYEGVDGTPQRTCPRGLRECTFVCTEKLLREP